MNKIFAFFDKTEDKIRGYLSRRPILYAIVAGTGIVLFWRGIDKLAQDLGFSATASLVIGAVILLATGAFVSFFVGGQLILTGIKGEKKLEEKTRDEIGKEEVTLKAISESIKEIKKEMEEIRDKV